MNSKIRVCISVFVVFAAVAGSARAHWAMPTDAPVERLITNLEKYVEEHPDDAGGHYTLGRVHSLAYTLRTSVVGVYERRGDDENALPRVAGRDFQQSQDVLMYRKLSYDHPDWVTAERLEQQLRDPAVLLHHLNSAIEHLRRAVELNADRSEYHLTLAYTLDRGRHLASYVDSPAGLKYDEVDLKPELMNMIERMTVALSNDSDNKTDPPAMEGLRDDLKRAAPMLLKYRADADRERQKRVAQLLEEFWTEEAIRQYWLAFKKSYPKDSLIGEQPLRGLNSLVSYEAGKSFLRLIEESDRWENKYLEYGKEVRKGIAVLDRKPENLAITPIIISLDPTNSIDDLLALEKNVEFDLDGDGARELWPWVRPTTAFLVWDPKDTGVITNGRQLFGSVTWWMFFENGYQALNALDDDRDGWLVGNELDGIALWYDHNSNGQSDDGEVVSIIRTEVEAIATTTCENEGVHPINRQGVRLRDGAFVPSYDWVTTPVSFGNK